MMEVLEEQHRRLNQILLEYGRVGVAFSGGVDSSLLLRCALSTLGAGNVLVLHARSCLQSQEEQRRAENWFDDHGYSRGVERLFLQVEPLRWSGFAENSGERCYFCKRMLYQLFLEKLRKRDIPVLVDGTNMDDLKDRRPGLRAIHELGVEMPLVRASMGKNEVRSLGRKLGLKSWNQPSGSCLATRIPHGVKITAERLEQIGRWEQVLVRMGFVGCRVCPDSRWQQVVIKVQADQMAQVVDQAVRQSIVRFFRKEHIESVHLDLESRPPVMPVQPAALSV